MGYCWAKLLNIFNSRKNSSGIMLKKNGITPLKRSVNTHKVVMVNIILKVVMITIFFNLEVSYSCFRAKS